MSKQITLIALLDDAITAMETCKSQPATYYVLHFQKGTMVCEVASRRSEVTGWYFKLTQDDIAHGLKPRRWTDLEIAFRQLLERNTQCPKQSKPSIPTKLKNCLPSLLDPKSTSKDNSTHTETT